MRNPDEKKSFRTSCCQDKSQPSRQKRNGEDTDFMVNHVLRPIPSSFELFLKHSQLGFAIFFFVAKNQETYMFSRT